MSKTRSKAFLDLEAKDRTSEIVKQGCRCVFCGYYHLRKERVREGRQSLCPICMGNKYERLRCPICGSAKPHLTSIEEGECMELYSERTSRGSFLKDKGKVRLLYSKKYWRERTKPGKPIRIPVEKYIEEKKTKNIRANDK